MVADKVESSIVDYEGQLVGDFVNVTHDVTICYIRASFLLCNYQQTGIIIFLSYATEKLQQCYTRILILLDGLDKKLDILQRNVAK
jgi:hypothetical protein